MEFAPPPVPLAPFAGFEDLVPGRDLALGAVTIDLDDVIDFARTYDPQPFHLDEAAAAASIFAGFSASGFQSLGLAWAVAVRSGLFVTANLAGAGLDEVRWLKPVRPGDRLQVRCRAETITASSSRPGRARVSIRYEVLNGEGIIVASMLVHHVMRSKDHDQG
jgi:acyl dehydratase